MDGFYKITRQIKLSLRSRKLMLLSIAYSYENSGFERKVYGNWSQFAS